MVEAPLSGGARLSAAYVLKFLLFFVLPLLLAFNVDLNADLLDSFHEGEYLGNIATMKAYYQGEAGFPLLVHGAMNYIPSLIASSIDQDRVVAITRLINMSVVALCWLAWLDIGRVLLRKTKESYVWGAILLLLFVFLASVPGSSPVLKHAAFVATRDLFLILSIWCLTYSIKEDRAVLKYALGVGLGACAAVSLYWNYDRGLASLIVLLAAAFAYAIAWNWRSALTLIISYIAVLLAISESGIFGTLSENIHNISYWLFYAGDVWLLTLSAKIPALPGALVMLVFSSLVIFFTVKKLWQAPFSPDAPLILGLLAIQMLFLMKLYFLPGIPIAYYFVWPAILLMLIVVPGTALLRHLDASFRQIPVLASLDWRAGGAPRVVILILLAIMALTTINAVVMGLHTAKYGWRLDTDDNLILSERYGLDLLRQQEFDCVFNWSNEGIFSLVSERPHCTDWPYAVYISTDKEVEALAQLMAHPPGLIVYDSPNWSMGIFGRHMNDRLPKIDRFIQDHYEFHADPGGYVFATPIVDPGQD